MAACCVPLSSFIYSSFCKRAQGLWSPPLGKTGVGSPLEKAWLHLGRCGSAECCSWGISSSLTEWALLRTLSLASPLNNPATLQTQCNILLSTSTDNRLSEWGRKKRQQQRKETGMLLEIIGLWRPFLKSLYYWEDELAINSRMDRQSVMCKRIGLRQFSIIWEISVLIEALRASMRVEL